MAVNTGYSPEGMKLKEEHIKMQRDMLVLSGRLNQMDLSFESQFLDDDDKSKVEEWDRQELEKERAKKKEEMKIMREAEMKLKQEEAQKKIKIWQEKEKEKGRVKAQNEKKKKEELLKLGKKNFLKARMEYEAALYFDSARFSLRNDVRSQRDLYESEDSDLDDSKVDFADPDAIENDGAAAARIWGSTPGDFGRGSLQQVDQRHMEVLRPRLNGEGNLRSHLPVIPEPSRPRQGEARQAQPLMPKPSISQLANGNYRDFS